MGELFSQARVEITVNNISARAAVGPGSVPAAEQARTCRLRQEQAAAKRLRQEQAAAERPRQEQAASESRQDVPECSAGGVAGAASVLGARSVGSGACAPWAAFSRAKARCDATRARLRLRLRARRAARRAMAAEAAAAAESGRGGESSCPRKKTSEQAARPAHARRQHQGPAAEETRQERAAPRARQG